MTQQQQQESSLGHLPAKDKWEFDGEVTRVFEDMLHRSIPQYDVMRRAVADLAAEFVVPSSAIIDVGCSRGDALATLLDRFGSSTQYLGLEISKPMLDAARERFADGIKHRYVTIREWDLRKGMPAYRSASVVLSVLTLMFVPIEHRFRLMRAIYDAIWPGGVLILVEKILGDTARIDDLLVKQYYAFKAESGYSQEEIERKRLALEGVLVPMTAEWNVGMLRRAGFQEIDCFWRMHNFAGWIAVK